MVTDASGDSETIHVTDIITDLQDAQLPLSVRICLCMYVCVSVCLCVHMQYLAVINPYSWEIRWLLYTLIMTIAMPLVSAQHLQPS